MTKKFSYRSVLIRTAVILPLAFGVTACDTISDLDPTGLLSDDASTTTADSQFPATPATQPSDADQGTTPDLAGLPARPDAPSAAAQQQTAQALAADGAQVRYSADALRGGTEAAALPPGAADMPPTAQMAAATPGSDVPPSAEAPPTADLPPVAAAPVGPSSQSAAVPASSPVQTASIAPPSATMPAPPPGAEPAVPANTPVRGGMASAVMSDASLGFKPSSAPPLDSSITQWVAGPIVAHYRQTASNAGISQAMASPAVPAVSKGARGMGGPDMSGAVVANLDAISAPGGMAVMNGGVPPTAVVYFPGDGTALSAAARAQIRSAATAFKVDGGQGSIRVVGHASSRTANMPVEKHLESIFDKSQKRANAVAQELIHDGVPAAQVLVEAVGDSQPVYFESMPKGEDGNRRAEIFVQS